TSMAAPHVAAAAAVVWSADPDLSNTELRGLLQETALDQGAPGRDVAYGYGVIRSRTAVDQVIVPTAIDLASFAAEAQDGAIQVTWETVEEIDNLGFDLYRATSRDGARTQLNDTLIPNQVAPGSPTGAVYTWLDDDVEAGLTYYYWLEDVDASGAITRHGPVQATLSALVFETEEAFAIRRIVPSRPAK
ncbi:MAG: S8 family serine peptidase, partial [Anaerolineae bacterium]